MQLKDAIQEFILECKVRRLVPRTIDNYGKHLRYLTNYLAEECQLEKLEDIKSTHIKKFLLMKEEQGCKPHYINDLLKVFKTSFRYCTEEEYIKSNPAKRVHNVRQPNGKRKCLRKRSRATRSSRLKFRAWREARSSSVRSSTR